MELVISSRGGKSSVPTDDRRDEKEFKKGDKYSKDKVAMSVTTTTPVKILVKSNNKKKKGSSFQSFERKRPALKELQVIKYPFPDSDLSGMLDDLLEKGIIELPKSKRSKEAGRTNDPNFSHFHRVIGYPIEKCITLKERIMQLAKGGKILLDLDEKAETNHVTAMVGSSNSSHCSTQRDDTLFQQAHMIQFGTLEPMIVEVLGQAPKVEVDKTIGLAPDDDDEGWTVVTRRRPKRKP